MQSKRSAIVIGILGIAIEVVAVLLLAQKKLPTSYGTPMVITGMLMAFVPLFVLARMKRKP